MDRSTILLLIGAFAACDVSAQAYKCKDASGETKYQQTPCATSAKEGAEVKLFFDPSPGESEADEAISKQRFSPKYRAELEALVSQKKVRIGMTSGMVKRAWGAPDKINVSSRASGRSEQWVWGTVQYAYFEDGILTSVQQSK